MNHMNHLTHFIISLPLENIKKPFSNIEFSDVFRGSRKGALGMNGLP